MPTLQPNSCIHQLNARVKLILTLAFILALSMTPTGAWPAFILFLCAVLCVAILSHISICFMLKRALLVLPFMLAAVPVVFWGPAPVFRFALGAGIWLTISLTGLERFLSITLKSWISLQATIILAMVTPIPEMLVALRSLGMPRIFVAIIGLMWRYLSIFLDEARRLLRARASRSSISSDNTARRSGGSLIWRGRVAGGMTGNLLLRGLERSDRIYATMLSRGYNGEPPFYHVVPLKDFERQILLYGLLILFILWCLAILTGGR